MTNRAEIVRARAAAVIEGVRRDEVGAYRMIKRLVATTIKEYRGRFLHELIQNGYDAHPPHAEHGKIAVHFDDSEGEHGVLYVANGGRPLSESNFGPMASLGDSDKPVGVGIGNKGVGFKSVFQICDVPEVYSALDDTDPGFNGFSFRFGMASDLDQHVAPDDPLRHKIDSELSLSMLTVPLDAPPHLTAFRDQGYVTVLRLPAASERAASEIQERIDQLLEARTPILLFLDRLELLSVQLSSSSPPTLLTRQQTTDDGFTRVALNGDESYLVFEGVVESEDLSAALQDAVDEGALDEHWLGWSAEARVSVAVGEGHSLPTPAAFTFLPMGDDVASPLGGHINAPFMTDFSRLHLDVDQPVNRLMMQTIAEVCVEAADQLVCAEREPGAVVDLLAWDRQSRPLISAAALSLRQAELDHLIRVPVVTGGEWVSLRDVNEWRNDSLQVMTAERLARIAHAQLIDTDLVDAERIRRLARMGVGGEILTPSPPIVAEWAELVAGSLAMEGVSLAIWRQFYDDLPRVFTSGAPLQGRKILLDHAGRLAPANDPLPRGSVKSGSRGERAAYFAPKSAGTDDDDAVDSDVDVAPPPAFARRIVFLHSDLEWYDGPQQTPGRRFLQDQRLVRQFRTASLISHLGQLLAGTPSDPIKRDSLDFAFRLFATNPTRHSKELAGIGLQVPTLAGGWVAASEARFSRDWGAPGAEDLSDVVSGAPAESSQLAGIAKWLVVSPGQLGIQLGKRRADESRWREFLTVLGASATLPILQTNDPRRIYGNRLTVENIVRPNAFPDIPRGAIEQWGRGVTTRGNTHHPETHFTTSDPICWLPGQDEIGAAPSRVREAYARLLIRTLAELDDSHKWCTWTRARSGGTATQVETPLWSFIVNEAWVPVSAPNEPHPRFEAPADSWFAGAEDRMAAAYSPLVQPRLRTLMEAALASASGWKSAGFRSWTDPRDAEALIEHLTRLYIATDIPDTAREHFRASLASAWSAVGSRTSGSVDLGDGIIVEIGGQVQMRTVESEGRLFVTSTHDQSSTARLVRELNWPMVPVESDNEAVLGTVARVIAAGWRGEVHVTSGWELDVLADGRHWASSSATPRLADEVPWLSLIIAASMRFPRASGLRVGRQLARDLEEMTRIRLARVGDISVASAGGNQPLPARLRGFLPLPGDPPTLLAQSLSDPLTWQELEALAQTVLELVGQERFKAEVSLSIRDLAVGPDHPVTRPTNNDIASTLQVSVTEIQELESLVFGAVAGILARLHLVAAALWGVEAVASFADSATEGYTPTDVRNALMRLGIDEQQADRIIVAASDSVDADELRRRLGVSVGDYNSALATYFPSEPLVNNGTPQAEEFDLRRRQRRSELVEWIRRVRATRFHAGELQPDWLELIALDFLKPDESWATTMDDLGNDLIDDHIDAQMRIEIGESPPNPDPLSDWETVRRSNARALRPKLPELRRVIVAWCERRRVLPPAVWVTDSFETELWMSLEQVGALDFAPLNDEELSHWMDRIGAWPSGMEHTLDPARHGVTDEQLQAQEASEAGEKARRLRESRRVTFQGEPIDLDHSMVSLVDRVSEFLESAPTSLETQYRTAKLDDLSPIRTSRTRADGGNARRGRIVEQRLSHEQTLAIGLAGELIAYYWLKKRDPSAIVDESCWRSGNRRFAFSGSAGDDGLGYDFEIPRKGGSVMYEVKATSGDAGMIELGETEVRCAQRYANGTRWRLLVVENTMSDSPRVHMLPNPFRAESQSIFSFAGNSVRLRFLLDD